jgi:hypothetical protein
MNHADFRVVAVEDDRVFIVDEDLGSKSVTNDAEWVWEQVSNQYPHRRLIYRDSMNRWDEMVPVMPSDEFAIVTINFRPYDEHVPF